jgi:hypothetical protein
MNAERLAEEMRRAYGPNAEALARRWAERSPGSLWALVLICLQEGKTAKAA